MAVTTTFNIVTTKSEFQVNQFTPNTQLLPDVLGLSGGGFVSANYQFGGGVGFVLLDFYDANHNVIGGFRIPYDSGSDTDASQFQPSLTELANGNVLVVWDDDFTGDEGFKGRIFTQSGTSVTGELDLANSAVFNDPKVAALDNGEFVVSYHTFTGTFFRRYDAAGNQLQLGTVTQEDGSQQAEIAKLADGGFVITFVDAAGNDVFGRIFEANGTVRTGIFDISDFFGDGNPNTAPKVAALKNGNFAVVYADGAYSPDGIGLEIFNANGVRQFSDFLRVDSASDPAIQPDITVLENGFIVVSWTRSDGDSDIMARVFTEDGTPITVNGNSGDLLIGNGSVDTNSAISALLSGKFVTVWEDAANDGGGGGIRGEVNEITRTSNGDGLDNSITGDALRDIINGNDGDDELFGRGGDDTINGGAGNDRIRGGDGDDIINGGGGLADLYLFGGSTSISVNLNLVGAQNTGQGIDTISNIEDVIGSDASDSIIGNSADNRLIGRAGNDVINGSSGNDVLQGRTENDILIGGNGNDKLRGQAHNDFLQGGLGKDVNAGGGGSDTFDFNSTAESGITGATRDKIKDFTVGVDTLDVADIDANIGLIGNQAFVLDTGGAFVAGEIRQIIKANKTILEFNTDGDATPEMEIVLLNSPGALSATDIVL